MRRKQTEMAADLTAGPANWEEPEQLQGDTHCVWDYLLHEAFMKLNM